MKNRNSATPSAFVEFANINSVLQIIKASQRGLPEGNFLVGGKRPDVRISPRTNLVVNGSILAAVGKIGAHKQAVDRRSAKCM